MIEKENIKTTTYTEIRVKKEGVKAHLDVAIKNGVIESIQLQSLSKESCYNGNFVLRFYDDESSEDFMALMRELVKDMPDVTKCILGLYDLPGSWNTDRVKESMSNAGVEASGPGADWDYDRVAESMETAGVGIKKDNSSFFLHSHPDKERELNLDLNHVIVDRKDWEEVMRARAEHRKVNFKYKKE